MADPVRLRLSRAKGFDLQALSRATNGLECVVVSRPTKWGNPWSIRRIESGHWYVDGPGASIFGQACENEEGARLVAVAAFRRRVEHDGIAGYLLHGKNLACWCALDAPCHADVLLKLANAPSPSPADEARS